MILIPEAKAGTSIELEARAGLHPSVHVFDEDSILAVNTAMAAQRPLLLRGETGSGKSQLARAAAQALQRNYHSMVVDSQTESRDLLWTLDSVTRLGAAQVLGAQGKLTSQQIQEQLAEQNFLTPRALWWGLNRPKAREVASRSGMPEVEPDQEKGTVVLIDEIDKADPSVPNGLLEVLGDRCFRVPGIGMVEAHGPAPLVVITTNEERSLPAAFLRRCLVHNLSLPDDPTDWLIARGRSHFPDLGQDVLTEAADLLVPERRKLKEALLSAPGQAEYLDLLRAVDETCRSRGAEGDQPRLDLLRRVAKFALAKHPPEVHG